jgi:hypothetical protein
MLLIVPLGLGGCGVAEPPGTPLEHGQWRTTTHFATPKVDGLSIDALRRQLPADTERSECKTPVIRTGPKFIEMFNLRQDACSLTQAKAENGSVEAKGECPALAAKIASGGGGSGYKIDDTDSWIKVGGTYEPRYVSLDAEIVMTVTTDRGETSRLTVNATHIAERTGDCS